MSYISLILLLCCSISSYGADRDIEKKVYQNNKELNSFHNLIKYVNFKVDSLDSDSKRYEDSKKNNESKTYYDDLKLNKNEDFNNYGDPERKNVFRVEDSKSDHSKRNEDSIICDDSKNFENQKEYESKCFSGNNFDRNNYYDDEDYEYVGNPDFFAEIERPCRVFDLNCIRRYFAEHSKCKIRRGPLPDSIFRTQVTHYISIANASGTFNNFQIGGLRSTRIEEFYIDKVTNKMVFSIQVRGLFENIPSNYFQFYRNGREPVVAASEVFIFFDSITFTAVIPIRDGNILLKSAEITAFAENVPFIYIGPAILSNPDPAVVAGVAQILADSQTNAQEFLLTSLLYPTIYIQFNICDFELKVQ